MDRERVNEFLYDIIDKYYYTETEKAIRSVIDVTSYETYKCMKKKLKTLKGDESKAERDYIKAFNEGVLAIIKVFDSCFPEGEDE